MSSGNGASPPPPPGVQGGDHGPGVSAVKMTAIEILECLFGGEMGGADDVKGCGPTPFRFLN